MRRVLTMARRGLTLPTSIGATVAYDSATTVSFVVVSKWPQRTERQKAAGVAVPIGALGNLGWVNHGSVVPLLSFDPQPSGVVAAFADIAVAPAARSFDIPNLPACKTVNNYTQPNRLCEVITQTVQRTITRVYVVTAQLRRRNALPRSWKHIFQLAGLWVDRTRPLECVRAGYLELRGRRQTGQKTAVTLPAVDPGDKAVPRVWSLVWTGDERDINVNGTKQGWCVMLPGTAEHTIDAGRGGKLYAAALVERGWHGVFGTNNTFNEVIKWPQLKHGMRRPVAAAQKAQRDW